MAGLSLPPPLPMNAGVPCRNRECGGDEAALVFIPSRVCTSAQARDWGTLIPEVKAFTKDLVPGIKVDVKERIAVMRKGGVIRLSDYCAGAATLPRLGLGLAWDVTDGVDIDLDASAILLDAERKQVDVRLLRDAMWRPFSHPYVHARIRDHRSLSDVRPWRVRDAVGLLWQAPLFRRLNHARW